MLTLLARLAVFILLFQLVRKAFRSRATVSRPGAKPREDPAPQPRQFDHLTPYEIEDADFEDLKE